ncbi:hypothetical protein FRC08_006123 [Ceratobasidium sp. 394]|nr:hypothetical protein FRC08_006123 [Ceratobasidium sp. 394]
MYIPLLPLITIATALQELTFTYLNYQGAADFIAWTAWGLVAGSATELVSGPVTFVRLQIEGQMAGPLMVHVSVQLEALPTFSKVHPTSSSYAPVINSPYVSRSSGGLQPTRPWSAIEPIHGYANGLSMSLSPLPPSLCTLPPGPTSLGNDDISGNTGPSYDPLTADDALTMPHSTVPPFSVALDDPNEDFLPLPPADIDGELMIADPPAVTLLHPIVSDTAASESIPTPPSPLVSLVRDDGAVATLDPPPTTPTPASPAHLTLSAVVRPSSSNHRWVPPCAWVLICAFSLAVLLDFAIGLYLTSPNEAELPSTPKNLRQREKIGELARMMDDLNVTPTELREHIELMDRERQAVHENPMVEAKPPMDQASAPASPDSSPLPGSPNAPEEGHVSTTSGEANSAPTTADVSVGTITTSEDPAAPEDSAAEAELPEDQGKYRLLNMSRSDSAVCLSRVYPVAPQFTPGPRPFRCSARGACLCSECGSRQHSRHDRPVRRRRRNSRGTPRSSPPAGCRTAGKAGEVG